MTSSLVKYKVEKFESDDYTPIAEVHNAVYPDHPMTANELAEDDARRNPPSRCERWIATAQSRVLAHGGFCQWPETYKEGEFTLIGGVLPQYRNKGIGSRLFQAVLERLHELDATILRSHSRADRDNSIKFLTSRGFTEFMRERDWELTVEAFDPSPYVEILSRTERDGILIRSMNELQNDPDRDRKMYGLVYELLSDTPGAQFHKKLPFNQWVNRELNNHDTPPEGYFVAIHGDKYVGKTHFNIQESDDTLLTRLTGVIKSHRRRGIALALKVTAIEWARSNGYPKILTDNESNNAPMLKLNERLGFKRLPEWIFFEKRLRDRTDVPNR